MTSDALPPFIRHLLKPGSYPHPADDLRLVQTHISFVLLAGDFVYKFKKPVDFGFLDFTTLAKRKFFCEQELVLNRRLCPDLYLGVVTVTEHNGLLALDGAGEAREYGVKMKRMPEERMMARLLAQGQCTAAMLDAIVMKLVPFYDAAAADADIAAFGSAQAVGVNVLENFTQTATFVGSPALSRLQYDTINAYARALLGHEELFQARVASGRVRDCHGDLYSANICLADQVYIYDCIEFNQRFRYCDVASDVAFLAMDLDFHGRPDLAEHFMEKFVAASGDRGLATVLNFYKCYRAYVRGKISLFTASAPEVDEATRTLCLEQARRYFILAEGYANA
jgi:aminoglycoside phosphotransferase family enzyme